MNGRVGAAQAVEINAATDEQQGGRGGGHQNGSGGEGQSQKNDDDDEPIRSRKVAQSTVRRTQGSRHGGKVEKIKKRVLK